MTILFLSVACWPFAQQQSQEASPEFSAESKLVLVPFNVIRDAHFARDVKPEDVALFQDGKLREFSIFAGPGTGGRLAPVELTVLFDTTTLSEKELPKLPFRYTAWDRDLVYGFVSRWGDAESRALLLNGVADVRVSIYRFDHRNLQRLCRSTREPEVLTNAIQRLPEPIPAGEAIPLALPPNRKTFEDYLLRKGLTGDPKNPLMGFTPSWTLEAMIGTLKDSSTVPGKAIRLLVSFTQAKGPTFTTPQDVADQAIAVGMPVYPVVLDWDQYYRAPVTGRRAPGEGRGGAPVSPRDPCDSRLVPNGSVCGGPTLPLLQVGSVGELTGGRAFYPHGIDEQVVSNILEVIRNEGLFQYAVGFVPQLAGNQRQHRLEVRLKSKSSGKLTGGKRTAVY